MEITGNQTALKNSAAEAKRAQEANAKLKAKIEAAEKQAIAETKVLELQKEKIKEELAALVKLQQKMSAVQKRVANLKSENQKIQAKRERIRNQIHTLELGISTLSYEERKLQESLSKANRGAASNIN